MDLNWLYGPKHTRAYRLDLDTVRELGEAIRQADPAMIVTYGVQNFGVTRDVQEKDLERLSAADLSRLVIDARSALEKRSPQSPGPRVRIALLRTASSIDAQLAPTEDAGYIWNEALSERLHQIVSDSGRPLIRWRRVRPLAVLAVVPLIVLFSAWLWLELTTPLPAQGHLIGWSAVVLAVFSTRTAYQRAKAPRREEEPLPYGHIVLSETRRETAARRGDHRRDVRVALYAVSGTVLAATILYFALGIGAPTPVESVVQTP